MIILFLVVLGLLLPCFLFSISVVLWVFPAQCRGPDRACLCLCCLPWPAACWRLGLRYASCAPPSCGNNAPAQQHTRTCIIQFSFSSSCWSGSSAAEQVPFNCVEDFKLLPLPVLAFMPRARAQNTWCNGWHPDLPCCNSGAGCIAAASTLFTIDSKQFETHFKSICLTCA